MINQFWSCQEFRLFRFLFHLLHFLLKFCFSLLHFFLEFSFSLFLCLSELGFSLLTLLLVAPFSLFALDPFLSFLLDLFITHTGFFHFLDPPVASAFMILEPPSLITTLAGLLHLLLPFSFMHLLPLLLLLLDLLVREPSSLLLSIPFSLSCLHLLPVDLAVAMLSS